LAGFLALSDPSSLLAHEVAYCLGQLQLKEAIPHLSATLENPALNSMVRHEAGEALGALGDPVCLPILERFKSDPISEIAETCQVSIDLIHWKQKHPEFKPNEVFLSVDPAPAGKKKKSVVELRTLLLDQNLSIFKRYKALFGLRNINSKESALAICDAFGTGSALFDHELAYVLGQLAHDAAVPALTKVLENQSLHDMVRHEAAEALGAIADDVSLPLLKAYANDSAPAVKDSCNVALDLHAYYNSDSFQYADGLTLAAAPSDQ
jgi:deoxyhypusine monooxygenase